VDVVFRRSGETLAAPILVVCTARANIDPVIHIHADDLSFLSSASGSKEVALESTDTQYHIVSVESTHKALSGQLAADKRKIIVGFDPGQWREGSGVPKLIVRTDCPFEDRIYIPVVVYSSSSTP